MKRFLIAISVFAMAISCAKDVESGDKASQQTGSAVVVSSATDAVKGAILVKLTPSMRTRLGAMSSSESINQTGDEELDGLIDKYGASLKRVFPVDKRYEGRTHASGLDLWYSVSFDEDLSVSEVGADLAKAKSVRVVEYMHTPQVSDDVTSQSQSGDESLNAGDGYHVHNPSRPIGKSPYNDPFAVKNQWYLNNPGVIGGKESVQGLDINAYNAWTLSTGNPDVIVAVNDLGVMHNHPDLEANMWVNEAEKNGTAGVDDDGNGYIDDIYGFNFTTTSGKIVPGEHGTHVAGIVSAVNNNKEGVSSLSGGTGKGDGVKIMTCQIATPGNVFASNEARARAIKYGADNGAVISQNSWSYPTGSIPSEAIWNSSFSVLADAFRYFIEYAGTDDKGNQTGPMKGGIVCVAAGNEGVSTLSFPAAASEMVAVSSLSYKGVIAYYSNYGSWVDISGYGGDMLDDLRYGGIYSTSVDQSGKASYSFMQGTSQACPTVSSSLALAISYYWGNGKNMGLTAANLKEALFASTYDIYKYNADKFKGQMGIGAVDAYRLLQYVSGVSDVAMVVGDSRVVNLSTVFGQNVAGCTAQSDKTSTATVTVDNGKITISAVGKGVANVTLKNAAGDERLMSVLVRAKGSTTGGWL